MEQCLVISKVTIQRAQAEVYLTVCSKEMETYSLQQPQQKQNGGIENAPSL